MFRVGTKNRVVGAVLAVLSVSVATQAGAHARHHHLAPRHMYHFGRPRLAAYAAPRYAARSAHVIQCVAFAKQDAGIEITGNARDWWSNAAGVYERGSRPESGSVLSFRENGRMPLGHVAVVSAVEDSRTIAIDQSHWNSPGITRDLEVKDVSENNDWSAVRVQLGHGGGFGSIYPTHGFIYPRPDQGVLVANVTRAAMPALERAPADLRRTQRRVLETEVAEAPERGRGLDLTIPISFDAPNRSLR